jgi:hypothetical protein
MPTQSEKYVAISDRRRVALRAARSAGAAPYVSVEAHRFQRAGCWIFEK